MRDQLAAAGTVVDQFGRCESLLLYLRSDLRAQGIITPGRLRRIFLLLAAAATAAGSFHQIAQLMGPPGPSPWQYAALTLGAAGIYFGNGLTVGRETLSSATAHRQFLATQPLSKLHVFGIHGVLIAARISAVSLFLIFPGLVAGVISRPNIAAGLTAVLGLALWPSIPGAVAARWTGLSSPASLGLIFLGASGLLLSVFLGQPGAAPKWSWQVDPALHVLGSPARLILGAGSWRDGLIPLLALAAVLALGRLRPATQVPISITHPAHWVLRRIRRPRLAIGVALYLSQSGMALPGAAITLGLIVAWGSPGHSVLSAYLAIVGPSALLALWTWKTFRGNQQRQWWWSGQPWRGMERRLAQLSAGLVLTFPIILPSIILGKSAAGTFLGWLGTFALVLLGLISPVKKNPIWRGLKIIGAVILQGIVLGYCLAKSTPEISIIAVFILDAVISTIFIGDSHD